MPACFTSVQPLLLSNPENLLDCIACLLTLLVLKAHHCHLSRMMESADAIDDSDDEVDYTKMDQGNKKGPVGRWDFETQEEYSDYMANKEALPKLVSQHI